MQPDEPSGPSIHIVEIEPSTTETSKSQLDPSNLPVCPICQNQNAPHSVGERGGYEGVPYEIVMRCDFNPQEGWFPIGTTEEGVNF